MPDGKDVFAEGRKVVFINMLCSGSFVLSIKRAKRKHKNMHVFVYSYTMTIAYILE